MMKAKGLLANVERIENAEEQLLDIMDVIEGRLVQALAGLFAIKLFQYHTCACRENCLHTANLKNSCKHHSIHVLQMS